MLKYLESELFLNEFSSLIDKNTRSELENSIIKSLYWIGEAHKDKSNSSAFVKLWSALECFFTLGEEKINESNSRGISSIIIFGGFIFDEYQEYNDLKKRVKFLYGLRSKIVHHAIHTHIDDVLLGEIALISSWVTIVMMSLVNKGYTDLKQVEFETKRLDNISKR